MMDAINLIQRDVKDYLNNKDYSSNHEDYLGLNRIAILLGSDFNMSMDKALNLNYKKDINQLKKAEKSTKSFNLDEKLNWAYHLDEKDFDKLSAIEEKAISDVERNVNHSDYMNSKDISPRVIDWLNGHIILQLSTSVYTSALWNHVHPTKKLNGNHLYDADTVVDNFPYTSKFTLNQLDQSF